ncbi:MAG: M3 family metallopeptidase [Thermomicrobia bacterium]|nr:M3 family metallopeptidase [Thermomicrobia bacterium]
MANEHLLDLDSRKGKAPGGYCIDYPYRGRPFIFMNAVGVNGDVETLLHESGHAFHVFEAHHIPLYWQRHTGSEMAEVASMSMELLAVSGRVVEAILDAKDVIAVVGEPGVGRHLLPQSVLLIEDIGQRVVLRDIGLGAESEGPLAHGAIRAEEERLQAGQRNFLALPLDRHPARQLVVLRVQPLLFADERHILLTEDCQLIAETAEQRLQSRALVAEVQQPPGETDVLLVHLRLDLAGKAHLRRFLRLIRGISRVGVVRDRARLYHHLFQPRPLPQPPLDVRGVERAGGQVLVVGQNVVPCRLREGVGGIGQCHDHQLHSFWNGVSITMLEQA